MKIISFNGSPRKKWNTSALLEKAWKDLANIQWLTNWQIILAVENRAIGSACFMGPPNEKSEVEIGYGINDPYYGHGYMTEAIVALSAWALQQDGVKVVTAKTNKGVDT